MIHAVAAATASRSPTLRRGSARADRFDHLVTELRAQSDSVVECGDAVRVRDETLRGAGGVTDPQPARISAHVGRVWPPRCHEDACGHYQRAACWARSLTADRGTHLPNSTEEDVKIAVLFGSVTAAKSIASIQVPPADGLRTGALLAMTSTVTAPWLVVKVSLPW